MKRWWIIPLVIALLLGGVFGWRAQRNAAQREALAASDPAQLLREAQVGGLVTLGRFAQEDETAEPIRWIVLEQDGDRLLLISEKLLACMPYHDRSGDITWEDCSLRKWLNGAFLETAFSDVERALITETENENPDEDVHGTLGGNDTVDRVFLLSELEARVYLKSEEARTLTGAAVGTEAAKKQGLHSSENGASPWWLRSPGVYQDSAVYVNSEGTVDENGAIVTIDYYCGVRPVLWVDIG